VHLGGASEKHGPEFTNLGVDLALLLLESKDGGVDDSGVSLGVACRLS